MNLLLPQVAAMQLCPASVAVPSTDQDSVGDFTF